MVKGDEIIMCKAKQLMDTLVGVRDEYATEIDKLAKLQSKYDRDLNLLYHDLEQKTFNAAEGYYISKKMQDTLRKRRIVKQELYELQAISKTLGLNQFLNKIPNAEKGLRTLEKDNKKGYTANWDLKVEDFEHELIS